MKHLKRILGLPLIVAGVVLIVVCFLLDCGHSNIINISGTILIAVGIGSYIWLQKNESKY